MKHRKKKELILAAVLLVILSGCTTKKIFVNPEDTYKLVAYRENEIEDDAYYVKDGANFYELYLPLGTVSSATTKQSDERLFWINEDASLIPTLYQDELIAYQSSDSMLKKIKLERFKDLGWSIGLYNGEIDEEGLLCYDISKDIVRDSNAYTVFKDAFSENLRIISINGEPISKAMIDTSGTIKGLTEGDVCELEFYLGTKYGNITVEVDVNYLQSYEIHGIDKAYTTKNGYLAIYMDESLKSGFYYLNGYGLFKYYAFEKGENKLDEVDMNVSFYTIESERLASYAQQYFFNVEKRQDKVGVYISYDNTGYELEEIKCIMTAPNGTEYVMINNEGVSQLELSEAMPGKWIINVIPKELAVNDIKVESIERDNAAFAEEEMFIISEPKTDITFYAEYDGDGKAWGVVENENGESQVLTVNEKKRILSTNYNYLPAGTYTVTIYHYNDTTISDISYTLGDIEYEEVINMELVP